MYMYQLTSNVIIIYCKHVLINTEKKVMLPTLITLDNVLSDMI